MPNIDDLIKKLEIKPLRSLADSDHRQEAYAYSPNGITVTLSEDERAYLMHYLTTRECA